MHGIMHMPQKQHMQQARLWLGRWWLMKSLIQSIIAPRRLSTRPTGFVRGNAF